VAKSATRKQNGFLRGDLRRRACGSHDDNSLSGFKIRAEIRRSAHLEHDHAEQSFFFINPRACKRQTFHRQRVAVNFWRISLVILQAEELPRMEMRRGERRMNDYL